MIYPQVGFLKSKSACTIDGVSYPRCPVNDELYASKVQWFEHDNVLKNFAKQDKCPVVWADPCALDMPEEVIDLHLDQRPMWNPSNQTLETVRNLTNMYIYHVKGKEAILPFNPTGRTGTIGRGILGKYGPNHAVDALVTFMDDGGVMWVFCILRADTKEWALVGGMVDPKEKRAAAVEREFREEVYNDHGADKNAAVDAFMKKFDKCLQLDSPYAGYVDDPRNTDNAWMETKVYHYNLDAMTRAMLKPNPDTSEALKAAWHKATDEFCDNMYASHGELVKHVRDEMTWKFQTEKHYAADPAPDDDDSPMTYQLDVATRRLFVSHIAASTTEMRLNEYFAKFGVVSAIKILPKKSDMLCAFIDFETVDDARKAYMAPHAIITVLYNQSKADRRWAETDEDAKRLKSMEVDTVSPRFNYTGMLHTTYPFARR
jgi:ADP-ribose pyrophosphatase